MNILIVWLLSIYCVSALMYGEYQEQKRQKEFREEMEKWRKWKEGRSDE